MRRILIAVDGSPSAEQALELGLGLAAEQGAEVAVVHVAAPDARSGDPGQAPFLRTAGDRARALGIPCVLELAAGDPAREIVALGEALGADLLVVGSRGRGAVAGALLGTVSKGILDRARRPVLVVRGRRSEAAG
jgi:nucleotide-binding universal stress UspA family protein